MDISTQNSGHQPYLLDHAMEPIEKPIAPSNAIKEKIEPVNLAPAKTLDDDSKSEPRTSKNSNTDSFAKTLIYNNNLNFTNAETTSPKITQPNKTRKGDSGLEPTKQFPTVVEQKSSPQPR